MKKKWYQPKNQKQGAFRFFILMMILALCMLCGLVYGLFTLEIYDGFGAVLSREWVSYDENPSRFVITASIYTVISACLIYGAHWAWHYYKKTGTSSE